MNNNLINTLVRLNNRRPEVYEAISKSFDDPCEVGRLVVAGLRDQVDFELCDIDNRVNTAKMDIKTAARNTRARAEDRHDDLLAQRIYLRQLDDMIPERV